jgi:hypothetical protein
MGSHFDLSKLKMKKYDFAFGELCDCAKSHSALDQWGKFAGTNGAMNFL